MIHFAEDGHHRILAALGRSSFSAEPPDVRAAAVIARMEANLSAFVADAEAALKQTKRIVWPGGPELRDQAGRIVSSEGTISGMVASLGGTLMMEGFANGWFDRKKGWLKLPVLPAVSDHEILLAGDSELLSMSWRRWTHLHESARYHDNKIHVLSGSTLPSGCPENIDLVYSRDAECDVVDFIANERAIDREGSAVAELTSTMDMIGIAKGIDAPLALGPQDWISNEEALNALSLSEAVGYEIVKDQERPGGLRLIQWVRGYICLAAWTAKRMKANHSGILKIPRADLLSLLNRCSLSSSEADTFLDAVSFGRHSRDLFDAPIVRTDGDWLLIGPALAAPRLARIVPSLLASMGIQLKRKGSAFEARIVPRGVVSEGASVLFGGLRPPVYSAAMDSGSGV
ncbi:hypothetical protein [Azospirillum canadense]|uniref:hypothetical protein n=1 Tax=Azospirillum canadense TaxID=403962 RepID=UPI002226EE9A|nr:hypothetical protein [Azospirillum canadense]MCW2243100.1 hypothetical protein [Azospirillum canadense]